MRKSRECSEGSRIEQLVALLTTLQPLDALAMHLLLELSETLLLLGGGATLLDALRVLITDALALVAELLLVSTSGSKGGGLLLAKGKGRR